MNRENILAIASHVMRDIKSIQENVYRGELVIIDRKEPAGVCFLDLRENIISWDGFSDYQEDLLAEDYYSTPGNQQWNYYLFLIQEKDKIDLDTKVKIEKDDKYARKYVFDEREFEDFFTLDAPTAEVTGNIVLEWKRRLSALGLQDVYSSKSYVSALSDFLNNRSRSITTSIPSLTTTSAQPELKVINKLILKEGYREYPQKKSFIFGKVNLFKGVNGVGKTSLFEAIELIACGKTFRNKERKELNGCVEAYINNNLIVEEKYSHTDTGKYRARDKFWYSNEYTSGNNTVDSFSRFNFFNTDAANNFVNSHKENQVKEALTNLILGPEYTFIRERMEGFRDRIRPEYNKLKNEIDDAINRKNAAETIINQLKASDSIQMFRSQILGQIEKLQLEVDAPQLDNEISRLEGIYNKAIPLVETFTRSQQSPVQSFKDLSIFRVRLEEKVRAWSLFLTKSEDVQGRIRNQSALIEKVKNEEQLYANAMKYFVDFRCFQLAGLSDRIQANKVSIDKIRSVHKILAGIVLDNFEKDVSFQTAKDDNIQLLRVSRDQLQENEHTIRNMLSKLDKVKQFITQIKSLGKEYLSLDQEAHKCPLCETKFDRDSLLEKINEILPDVSVTDLSIDDLYRQQSELKNSIDVNERSNNELIALWNAYCVINNNSNENVALSELLLSIRIFLERESIFLQEQRELTSIGMIIESNSLSEREFESISLQIRDINSSLVFSFENKERFITEKEKIREFLQDASLVLDELVHEKILLNQEIKTQLELDSEKELSHFDMQQQLDLEKRTITSYEDTFQKIRELIKWDDETSAIEIVQELSLLKRNVDSLKNELMSQRELNRAENEIVKATEFLAQNEEKVNRIKLAYDLLVELTSFTSINDLNDFFNQNIKEVNDIFRTIHSPREFHEILFENGEMLLLHESNNKRKISQISTGQRAALAVSVFISLHRKLKNGPNIVLFDDPVSYIDDLNALSFIDFLRIFLLKEGSQIFIATANARLAALIEKKFDFLGQDFKSWELLR